MLIGECLSCNCYYLFRKGGITFFVLRKQWNFVFVLHLILQGYLLILGLWKWDLLIGECLSCIYSFCYEAAEWSIFWGFVNNWNLCLICTWLWKIYTNFVSLRITISNLCMCVVLGRCRTFCWNLGMRFLLCSVL